MRFDESDAPLVRVAYRGVPREPEWSAHFDRFTGWARSGKRYALLIDARELGDLPPTHRRSLLEWLERDRLHLRASCVGGALLFTTAAQRGLWTGMSWVTPVPIPVKVMDAPGPAESWLTGLLRQNAP